MNIAAGFHKFSLRWTDSLEHHQAAGAFYREALAIEREFGEPVRIAEALYNQAFVAGATGDVDHSADLLEKSLELLRRSGVEHGHRACDGRGSGD